jgi:hypothetical protein
MMNLEEGFRRIGIVTVWVAVILGTLLFVAGEFILGFVIAIGVIFVGFVILYVVAYVIKGFMKQSDEEKDKD